MVITNAGVDARKQARADEKRGGDINRPHPKRSSPFLRCEPCRYCRDGGRADKSESYAFHYAAEDKPAQIRRHIADQPANDRACKRSDKNRSFANFIDDKGTRDGKYGPNDVEHRHNPAHHVWTNAKSLHKHWRQNGHLEHVQRHNHAGQPYHYRHDPCVCWRFLSPDRLILSD